MKQKSRSEIFDVFIAHASEDKESVARPLAKELKKQGINVWYDEFTLYLGDNLRKTIDKGISSCNFGVVILSPAFFSKSWPQRELDGLITRELHEGRKIILPVWHNIDLEDVLAYSKPLANKLAESTSKGLEAVVAKILQVLEEVCVLDRAALSDGEDEQASFEKLKNEVLQVCRLHSVHFTCEKNSEGRFTGTLLIFYNVPKLKYEENENDKFFTVPEKLRFLEMMNSTQSSVGLHWEQEIKLRDEFITLVPSLLGDPHCKVIGKHREIDSTLYGLFVEWEIGINATTPKNHLERIECALFPNRRLFTLNFSGKQYEDLTYLFSKSSRFTSIDAQIKRMLNSLLQTLGLLKLDSDSVIESRIVSESELKEDENFSSEPFDLGIFAPVIFYIWWQYD